MNLTYVILDLEMTCWESDYPPRTKEVIELAAVMLDAFGSEMHRFQRIVQPELNPRLSWYCSNLTGIVQEDVDEASTFPACHRDFEVWLDQATESILMVTWGAYDLPVLEDSCARYNITPDHDYMHLDAKHAYHEMRHLNERLGLVKTMKREGLEFEGDHHRALPDALNLARLFNKYIGEWPV